MFFVSRDYITWSYVGLDLFFYLFCHCSNLYCLLLSAKQNPGSSPCCFMVTFEHFQFTPSLFNYCWYSNCLAHRLFLFVILQFFFDFSYFETWGISLWYSPVLAGEYSVTWRIKINRMWAKLFNGCEVWYSELHLVHVICFNEWFILMPG